MKKLIIILTAAVFAVSCSDHLEDLNENIKDPSEVSGESLFASAQKRLADQITTPNVNLNNNRLWVQHWQETTYPDESNYDQSTRAIPDRHWRVMYRDVLRNLKEARTNVTNTDFDLTNDLKENKLAIIEVLSVYAWSNLVETYGDIPYTEALDIDNLLPKYDDGQTVYKDLLDRLTAAINSMDTSKGSFNGAEDLVYAGDVASWKKFANTLKLRMGIVLADVDPGASKTAVESAFTSGVFTSNADDAGYMYTAAPNGNPVNDNLVLSNRNDYVAGKTLIQDMNDILDPRRDAYFDGKVLFNFSFDPEDPDVGHPVGGVSTSGTVTTISFDRDLDHLPAIGDEIYLQVEDGEPVLLGTAIGYTANTIEIDNIQASVDVGDGIAINSFVGGIIGKQNVYSRYSHVTPNILGGDYPGWLLTYKEAEFLLAEAAARGYSVGGDAESHYDAGITASFDFWGVGDVADYLAKPEVDYTTALGNSTAATPWKEVIGTQAWLALYNRTFAPYLTIRRLDYPIMIEPLKAESGYPVRYTYPVSEINLNPSNYEAAASAIGGDETETRLFWDKFDNTWGF
ncbi:SusD/RagB family nutrient-binding outer membrane lipoprotein [Aequorivita marina]|uniref:SusD/RagB family nutrient-binding outer membrane lipoprotein n=1 Tax=Aequorivita marina TaxID=3073654 RepID=UPI0028752BFF|nr:SusD/RagB family nutrient-binding outer membrane lipoprotein [Aequorivita sp. S2608]MDS1298224.1 SusD/RagB family nutrient-binding outer membrane lipoprotein [Aequorivita sp. S2608]